MSDHDLSWHFYCLRQIHRHKDLFECDASFLDDFSLDLLAWLAVRKKYHEEYINKYLENNTSIVYSCYRYATFSITSSSEARVGDSSTSSGQEGCRATSPSTQGASLHRSSATKAQGGHFCTRIRNRISSWVSTRRTRRRSLG